MNRERVILNEEQIQKLITGLEDMVRELRQKVNQLKTDKTHLIEIISGLINYVKETYNEDLTDRTSELIGMVLDKEGGSND